MKSVQKNKTSSDVVKGDILIDCHGNKMVVLDLLDRSPGVQDVLVLLNGRVKLVNAMSSSIVKKEKISNKAN
tara:strand:- start:99 stop:314 length:216 start_codon:yes stop_codon:yes gene_type:complete